MARDKTLRAIVDLARLAPSIHNTQPWSWRIVGDVLELRVDRQRALPAIDPDGRNLVISCGTALHHAVVAADTRGLRASVDHLPDPRDRDLLGRISFTPVVPDPDAEQHLAAIRERVTDRRRFTSWPVPDDRVRNLARAAGHWGAAAIPVVDVSMRFRLELLMERARLARVSDTSYLEETERWLDRSTADGIPRATIPSLTGRAGERAHRFAGDLVLSRSSQSVESTDGLIVIATSTDDEAAWLHAGETLSALWLQATVEGLSLVPLSQVVEDAATRRSLIEDMPTDHAWPQLLARIGWQEISRSTLERTPRRALEDVLTG
jgi:hypothetical protein